MKNSFLKILLPLFCAILPAQALEDCIVATDAKLTEIRIENHEIIDVAPLITVMNEKNTLIVHPLQTGETKFSVLKGGKTKVTFNVKVENDKTTISEKSGFEIFTIDSPPEWYEYELDLPPIYFDSEEEANNR